MLHNTRYRAFTLVELMLVVTIVAVLTAMVVPRLTGRSETAKISVARADIDLTIATALKLYYSDSGSYPSTDEGLAALLTAPVSAKNWKGPYLDFKPVDPWGQEYRYKSPGVYLRDRYDLYSLGQDKVESSDDIVNWQPVQ